MFKTALLILTQPMNQICQCIPLYMTEINKLASKTAYIHIQPNTLSQTVDQNSADGEAGSNSAEHYSHFEMLKVPFSVEIRNLVKEFYVSNANICSNLDIRVLVGHIGNAEMKFKKYNFKDPCDIVLIDRNIQDDDKSGLLKSISSTFTVSSSGICQHLDIAESVSTAGTPKRQKLDDSTYQETEAAELLKQYPHTVLGGTFDRLHVGHKILLTEGCMLGTDKLTVGVTDGKMNNKKTLVELIQPIEERICIVKDFLNDVDPSMEYSVVPITDGFGPTVTDPTMDLIVLSQETKKGGEMINDERKKRDMKILEEYTIDLVEDTCHTQYEENKISSSSYRKRLLGTLYHPLKPKEGLLSTPYIIGLTGGIASGKSSVCKRLEGQGAKIVDCDKLGHKAYIKGTPGFDKVVAAFGQQVVGEDGEISRKELGKIVFGNKEELKRLNGIVWPEIAQLAKEQMQEYSKDGHKVIVLDAAVLLEAGWDDMCHEVWTTIVPQDEAVKRMIERNNLTEEQARQRLNSQITNLERVEKSNVILCTLWEYDYTQQQVEHAWRLLLERIPSTISKSNPKSNM
ncbi:bifunctional coenzyme A synthase-like isoform X2 [Mercenaria mercenaria]|uniref:bifunctional coenzyme A synthase-like isoform X2 n=1 Tax=Mercenaria mercenaria TaxID=6596 RepID=UPI00234F2EEF|nr:bifunctional coenzyme A synthase-like isoform X2 [Mercenaria mercenaria]